MLAIQKGKTVVQYKYIRIESMLSEESIRTGG